MPALIFPLAKATWLLACSSYGKTHSFFPSLVLMKKQDKTHHFLSSLILNTNNGELRGLVLKLQKTHQHSFPIMSSSCKSHRNIIIVIVCINASKVIEVCSLSVLKKLSKRQISQCDMKHQRAQVIFKIQIIKHLDVILRTKTSMKIQIISLLTHLSMFACSALISYISLGLDAAAFVFKQLAPKGKRKRRRRTLCKQKTKTLFPLLIQQ